MPGDRDPRVTVRFSTAGYRRLQGLAKARGLSLARTVRMLVDEGSPDGPIQPRPHLTEQDLLALLTERAEDGNVAAIRQLLEIERNQDPRKAAMDALQRMAEGHRQ